MEQNAGYMIIKTERVGTEKFALGYNPNAPQQYVPWKCRNNDRYYYHGHYFSDKGGAERDFNKRIKNEREYER